MSDPDTFHQLVQEPWMLTVERRGGRVLFDIHVESGFVGWNETFDLTEAQASALVADRRRRLLLWSFMHQELQNRRPMPPERFGPLCDLFCFGGEAQIGRLLDEEDGRDRSNGAISNGLRIALGLPERTRLPASPWFADLPPAGRAGGDVS